MNNMMTEKQIKNLRKVVRYKWIPWFMLLMGAFYLFAAGMKLFFVHRLCSLTGLTWNHVLSLAFASPEQAETYKGVEVLAADGIQGALLYIGVTVIFVVYYFVAKLQRSKDVLLLEYIDKGKEPQQPPPEYGSQTRRLC